MSDAFLSQFNSLSRIHIASPPVATGAAWLINCFLELGFRVESDLGDGRCIWQMVEEGKPESGWMMNQEAGFLQRHLPSLEPRKVYHFDARFVVTWSHAYPTVGMRSDTRVLVMLRDPRDAMYSQHRRVGCQLAIEDYLTLPDPQTLLAMPEAWALFHQLWLSWPGACAVSFEKYRQDPGQTLIDALSGIGLKDWQGQRVQPLTYEQIVQAAHASGFEQAKAAEQIYRQTIDDSAPVMNQQAKAGGWRDDPARQRFCACIEQGAYAMLKTLGYAVTGDARDNNVRSVHNTDDWWAYLRLFSELRDELFLPESVTGKRDRVTDPFESQLVQKLLENARHWDWSLWQKSGMSASQVRQIYTRLGQVTERLMQLDNRIQTYV